MSKQVWHAKDPSFCSEIYLKGPKRIEQPINQYNTIRLVLLTTIESLDDRPTVGTFSWNFYLSYLLQYPFLYDCLSVQFSHFPFLSRTTELILTKPGPESPLVKVIQLSSNGGHYPNRNILLQKHCPMSCCHKVYLQWSTQNLSWKNLIFFFGLMVKLAIVNAIQWQT